jgi:AraC-like DNA-binding protein
MAIAAYLSLGRKWSGVAFPAVQATFQHAEPSDTTEYRRLFGDRLRFNARQNTLTLSSATVALPLGTTDPDLLSYLQTKATNLIEQGTGISLEHQVRAAIATVMAETAPTLARIARHLAMSPRTLQRRLAEGSLQFHVLADEVRRVTALRLASARDAEVAAIARQVGYRDPDAFRAAFLRWTGKTPRDYRREPS